MRRVKKIFCMLLTFILTTSILAEDMNSVYAKETAGSTQTAESGEQEAENARETERSTEVKNATEPGTAQAETVTKPEGVIETETVTETEAVTETAKQLQEAQAKQADLKKSGELAKQFAQGEERSTETESENGSEQTTETGDTQEAERTKGDAASAVEQPYAKVKMADLLTAGTLTSSDTQNVTMTADSSAGGVLFSGTADAVKGAVYGVSQTFSFDGNSVGRISVDGLAEKNVNLSLELYLDAETTPFATIALNKQKKSGKWTDDGDRTADVSGLHITGTHQVSWKVVSDSTGTVTYLLRSIEFVESSVPVIYFNIDESQGTIMAMNQDQNHETECYGDMTIQIPDGYTSEYTDKTMSTKTYSLEYIRGRGNSTWMCDKKPYKIKLQNKENLFGMGKSKHWVLLANRYDNSLLRNKGTYWLGQQLGMEYTPQCVFVDVVMNGTYYGSYYLCDQVRVGSSSVDIDDLEQNEETQNATDEPTITGGYLLSMCPYGDEENLSFTTTKDNQFLIESPSFDGYSNDTQYNYIRDYVQKTEDAIYGEGFQTSDGVGYEDLLDVDSAVDYYWLQEISMNGDAFGSTSTYLYKKRDGKLYWGPLWDFDFVAWGDYDYSEEPNCAGFVQTERTWFSKLLENKSFAEKLVARWPQIKAKLLALSEDGGQLDHYKQQVAISERYDFEKWGAYDFEQGTPLTYDQEVERLKTWITNRVAWIDANVNTLIPTEYSVRFVDGSKVYAEQTVVSGHGVKDLPTPSTKKGYVFAGWYAADETGNAYKAYNGIPVYADTTFRAKWVKESEVVPVKNLYTLYKEVYVSLENGGYSVDYSVTPYDATFPDVTWVSSDNATATVDESGFVTLLKKGTVKITGTCANGVKTSYNLHIMDYDDNLEYPSAVSLDHTSLHLETGSYAKLGIVYEPTACYTNECRWYSLDESVAEISTAGVVRAVREGKTAIVVYNLDTGAFAKCEISVTDPVKKGNTYAVSNHNYKVTKTGKTGGNVTFTGLVKTKGTKVEIPDAVKIKGKTYKVTEIAENALKNKSGITNLVLGKNIASIGKNAFYGCKKLKQVTVKSAKIKSVGKQAWKKVPKNAKFKVPEKSVKQYQKLFRSAGLNPKIKITK